LSSEVAYAADGPEPSSPVSESNMFNRISQSGLSKLVIYAEFYEGVSMFREWLQEQIGIGSEKAEFLTAVEACHNAKSSLESIPFKYREEVELIKEANYVLKGCELPSELSLDALEEYKNLKLYVFQMYSELGSLVFANTSACYSIIPKDLKDLKWGKIIEEHHSKFKIEENDCRKLLTIEYLPKALVCLVSLSISKILINSLSKNMNSLLVNN
jgi:hypothetical protein